MSNKIKKAPKAAVANLFITSILSRMGKITSETTATLEKAPALYNPLTFLHDFIDHLELNEPAHMITAAAAQLSHLNPHSTTVLFFSCNRESIMVLAGSKPSTMINQEILTFKEKIQPQDSSFQIINKTQSQACKASTEYSETLTVAAATEPEYNSAKLILCSTAKPSSKERQLLNYCLQHLNKRLGEAQNLLELEKTNRLDSLTGLNNRRHFDEMMKIESDRADRYHHPTSLIMLDLDYFKKINDNFGHQTGDRVLETVGKILLSEVRQSDTPCRYGGEEFAIILPQTGLCEAQIIAERFRNLIEQQQITTHNNVNLKITASLGISSTEEHNNIDLTAAADQALYLAKNRGRNQIATSPSSADPAIEHTIKHCFPTQAVINE